MDATLRIPRHTSSRRRDQQVMNFDLTRPWGCSRPSAVSALYGTAAALLMLLGLAMPAQAVPLPSGAVHQPVLTEAGSSVAFGAWVGALTEMLDSTPAPAIEHEYSEFVLAHGLPADDSKLKREYRELRLLFEALRDGGFWHLRWAVTDQYPSSKLIWQAWIREPVRTGFAEPSATGECDESSALFGMLARHLRIYNVGLYYPTWNHTISVWAPHEGKAKTALIQLPTTQIFLKCNAGFDKTSFPMQLKNIERYPNWDVRPNALIPRARTEWLLHQIQVYAAASPALWSLVRAKRAYAMGSSMGQCQNARSEWRAELVGHLTEGDVSALSALAVEELGLRESNPAKVLAWLAE